MFDSIDRTKWLLSRREGLGASDMPIVLGLSSYKTRYQLWLDKSGLVPIVEEESFVTARGHQFEHVIREMVREKLGNYIEENVRLVDGIFSASLDGRTVDGFTVEIKLVGQDYVESLEAGFPIREDHFVQVQQQIMLTGKDKGYYAAYSEKLDRLYLGEVDKDDAVIARIRKEGEAFWALVKSGEAPELTPKDVRIADDNETTRLASEYRAAKQTFDNAELRLNELRERLTALVGEAMPGIQVPGAGLRVTASWRKGNVNYKKVPELKGVNLEPYRGTPTLVTRITLEG